MKFKQRMEDMTQLSDIIDELESQVDKLKKYRDDFHETTIKMLSTEEYDQYVLALREFYADKK